MTVVLLALGLVLVVEGLVLALAPRRLEDMLMMLAQMVPEQRRLIGLAALACGIVMIWLAHRLGV